MQLVAPVRVRTLVNEPAVHDIQTLCPTLPWYSPAVQLAQGTVECVLNWPAAHAVHNVPPIAVAVSVAEPGAQTAHATTDSVVYWPAPHAVHVVAPIVVKVLPILVKEPALQRIQLIWPGLL